LVEAGIARLGGCKQLADSADVSPIIVSNWRTGRFKRNTRGMLALRRLGKGR
jgi:hypothetical protein